MKFEFVNGIRKNDYTSGICAHIRTEDAKYYYADLSYTSDRGIEFMVFPANVTGRVTDWVELYASYPSEISEKSFTEQVEDWLQGKEQ